MIRKRSGDSVAAAVIALLLGMSISRAGAQEIPPRVILRDTPLRAMATEKVATFGAASGPEVLPHRHLAVLRHEDELIAADGKEAIRLGAGRHSGVLGGRGEGPGEYLSAFFVRADEAGNFWVVDRRRRRIVGFGRTGEPVGDHPIGYAGDPVDALFLKDGSFLVTSTGIAPENLGMLLHRYDFVDRSWSSFLPTYRDRVFTRGDRETTRLLELLPSGRVVVIDPFEYTLEIVDAQSEEVVARWSGGGPFWASFDEAVGDEVRRPRVLDAAAAPNGMLWILAVVPRNGEALARLRKGLPAGELDRAGGDFPFDAVYDSLIEIIDLEAGRAVASLIIEEYSSWLLGPGEVGHYPGDLPFPRVDILRIVPRN